MVYTTQSLGENRDDAISIWLQVLQKQCSGFRSGPSWISAMNTFSFRIIDTLPILSMTRESGE